MSYAHILVYPPMKKKLGDSLSKNKYSLVHTPQAIWLD